MSEHCFLAPPKAVGDGCYCGLGSLSLRFCLLLAIYSVVLQCLGNKFWGDEKDKAPPNLSNVHGA